MRDALRADGVKFLVGYLFCCFFPFIVVTNVHINLLIKPG